MNIKAIKAKVTTFYTKLTEPRKPIKPIWILVIALYWIAAIIAVWFLDPPGRSDAFGTTGAPPTPVLQDTHVQPILDTNVIIRGPFQIIIDGNTLELTVYPEYNGK